MKKIYFLLLMLFINPAAAEIYKWVDQQGRVHYDDKPPIEQPKELLNINEENNAVSGMSADRAEKRQKLLDAIDEDRQAKKQQDLKNKKKTEKITRQCHVAKDNLKRYQRSAAVYDLDKDGNRVTLPDSVRDNIIASLKKQIASHCK